MQQRELQIASRGYRAQEYSHK